MSVDLNIYKARIGMHRFRLFKIKGLGKFDDFEVLVFLSIILYQAGDIKKIPDHNLWIPAKLPLRVISHSSKEIFHSTLKCPKFAA